MMRSPKGSSSFRPTIAWQATPPWRQRVATSPTILPCERLLVERALAGHDEGGARACGRRSRSRRARRPRPARARRRVPAHRPPDSPPAAPVIGTPRGSRGKLAASSSSRRSSRSTVAASAPFWGPKTRAASLERRAHVADDVDLERSTPASPSASSAPAPPSVVAEPPTVTITVAAPASTAAAISSPVPRVDAAQASRSRLGDERAARSPAPSPRPPCARPSSSANARLDRAAERVADTVTRAELAAERGHQHVHRPLAAVGHRQLLRLAPRGAQARRRSRAATSARRERALEAVRARPSAGATRVTLKAPRGTLARPRRRAPRTRSARARPSCSRAAPTMIRAASSSGKPPTPVPNATSASERAPSSSAFASVERVARSMISRRRRAAELHRRGVDDPAGGHVAGGRLHRLAQPDRRPLVGLALHGRAAGPRDRPRHAAAVHQLRVRGVGDRVDLELRHVGGDDLELAPPAHPDARRAVDLALARSSLG